ncbi:MAG TPA: DinB family protein [Ktedonobacteraceae bacterium]|jgi:hypothetical protein|nr:DinB family protein [Ktedonobacteraceae bacterium]
MDLSQWFSDQLTSSAEGYIWSVEQFSPEQRFITPPTKFGEWSPARHVFHMYSYEQHIALPSMRIWLDEPFPYEGHDYKADMLKEEKAWNEGQHTFEELLENFRTVRAEQVVLLQQFSEAIWDEKRKTIWGDVSLKWIVTKTLQHTAEHTNDVLRMALFWKPES